jgi:hypothetical protein
MEAQEMVIAPSFSNVANNPNALTVPSPWPGGLATLNQNANGYQYRPGNPYLQSYNLTVEREIGRGVVIETAFLGSKGPIWECNRTSTRPIGL